MSTSKHCNKICCMILLFALVLTVCFVNAENFGIAASLRSMGYEEKIFDPSLVHTIDITMEDWEEFLENATSETYYDCDLVIDGESFQDVAIRGKGNTSLSSVKSLSSNRYSFKVEFDHYDKTASYHGLDKLCLNNTIQDKTYMKDFVTYQMMNAFDVNAPLCSFAYITVNGEDWGLYLAVEGVEDSFLQRNFGSDIGELYKPDSQSFGGGRGQGKDFRMSEFMASGNGISGNGQGEWREPGIPGEGGDDRGKPGISGNGQDDRRGPGGPGGGKGGPAGGPGGPGGGMGSDDVKLKYTDDDPESYANIFDSAKTDVSEADQKRLVRSLKSLSEKEALEDVLDIDEVLRYFVVHNFVVNGDSYTGSMIHNYYLYEKDGQLSMIPWDYNLAFGTFMGKDAEGSVNLPVDSPIVNGEDTSAGDRPMLEWIFSSEEYTERYHQYFEEFVESLLDSGYVTELITQTAELIAPYVASDPTSFYQYEDFEEGWKGLKEFVELRTESVKGQLSGEIPSTREGQEEDASALIDASSLDLEALGGMNDTKRGGGPGGGPDGTDRGMGGGPMQNK